MITRTQINPYLSFSGNCREAMSFYKECLGGRLKMQTVGESPMRDQWPEDIQEYILHATLSKDTMVLLGSDMGGLEGLKKGNSVSLALACRSEKELKKIFDRLSRGGKITHELHNFYDGIIGAITDKFGNNWILKY